MTKTQKKFMTLAAVAALGVAGTAWALTSNIDSTTNKAAWNLDAAGGNRNVAIANSAGYGLATTAGDFTFVQGIGMSFHSNIAVPQNLVAAGVNYDNPAVLGGAFARWTRANGATFSTALAPTAGDTDIPFPVPAEVNVGTGQTLEGAVRSEATVEFNLATTTKALNTVPTPVRKTGAGNWLITEKVSNVSSVNWVAPFGSVAGGAVNVNSVAGLRIAGGSVQYGTDNIVPTTQAIRFEAPTATLNLANNSQALSHIQSINDADGIVDFGTSGRGRLQVHNVNVGTGADDSAGFLFGDALYNEVTGNRQDAAVNDNVLYSASGWRGTFAGNGTLELNQANPIATTYTIPAVGATLVGADNVFNFPIRLRDAATTLVVKPNQHLDYHRGTLGGGVFTPGVGQENHRLTIAETDDNWTAARFNGGLLALDSDAIGGHKTHTMAGFVQNVRVDVRTGALRLVATTAQVANPSAFTDNVFNSLNINAGATFRLDDSNAPNADIASTRAGFRAVAGNTRSSVWARVDALSGAGTIDLGATTPEVDLGTSPARLRATGLQTGNAIDFNFTGNVNHYITGMGGIRITGGRTVTPMNVSNDFEGPILANGILEVPANHVTGRLNDVYLASGGGIRATGGARTIESGLIFDKNSYIYTQAIASNDVAHVKANGGIRLAATVVPNDQIKLTAPAVNAKAGTNIVVLEGDGVNTLVDRVLVTDNNGNPVLGKWAVRATANNELVLNALKDVNDADNVNPGPGPDPTPNPDPTPSGSSSSGCSTGAFASFAALLLAPLALLRKKD